MPPNELKQPQWFCIHTKPAHENVAVLSLQKIPAEIAANVGEMEIYFPKMRASIPVGGHMRMVTRPLFPRYFFAKFLWESASRFVASRPQVLGIVHFGDFPAVVSHEVIQDLILLSVDSENQVFDPTMNLLPGQRVIIKTGPFKGMEAEFIAHLNDQKRVSLLMDHLQSRARLIVDRSSLKAAI